METEAYDEADGIRNMMKRMGRYKPKKNEDEERVSEGPLSDYGDPDDQIFQLLKATAPNAEWREGLAYIMKESKEEVLRTTLAFLHNSVAAGINLLDDGAGQGTSVNFDVTSASDAINCADWMKIMEGLGFELTSPGTVRKIEYVDVAIPEKPNKEALEGFCCLVHSMLELSWENLQTLSKLESEDGNLLWEATTLLIAGAGIQSSSRSRLEDLERLHPYLMKSIGFRLEQGRLQWEKPTGGFDRLCWSLHGLFRRTDVIESPV